MTSGREPSAEPAEWWYVACSSCTAKWFTRELPAACPRCGSDPLTPTRARPPWLQGQAITSTNDPSSNDNVRP